jgi:hypothetical protein
VTYRVEPAVAAGLAEPGMQDGRAVLLDQHGRPLELLYGLVTTAPVRAGDADLLRARAEAVASYRRFLADEDGGGVRSSAPFTMREAVPVRRGAVPVPAGPRTVRASGTAVSPAPSPEADLPVAVDPVPVAPVGRDRAPGDLARGVFALLAALLAVLVALWVGDRSFAPPQEVVVHVQAASETSGRPLCSDVRVVGTIVADGSAAVSYYWTVDGRQLAVQESRPVDGSGEVTTYAPPVWWYGDDGRPQDDAANRRYELVATPSDRKEWRSGTAAVDCALERP